MELPEPLGWNLEDIYCSNNQIIFDLPIIHKSNYYRMNHDYIIQF